MQQFIPQDGAADVLGEPLQPGEPYSGTVLQFVANYFACDLEGVLSWQHRKGYLLAASLLRSMINIPLGNVAALFGTHFQSFPSSAEETE